MQASESLVWKLSTVNGPTMSVSEHVCPFGKLGIPQSFVFSFLSLLGTTSIDNILPSLEMKLQFGFQDDGLSTAESVKEIKPLSLLCRENVMPKK